MRYPDKSYISDKLKSYGLLTNSESEDVDSKVLLSSEAVLGVDRTGRFDVDREGQNWLLLRAHLSMWVPFFRTLQMND